jgi:hypothetical protein
VKDDRPDHVRDNLKKHGGDMSAVAAEYRQQGGGKRPASQAANRLKKKPALSLLHKKNPLQGELPTFTICFFEKVKRVSQIHFGMERNFSSDTVFENP